MAYDHHDGSFGVYMAQKILKLQEYQNVDQNYVISNIFEGCLIFVNGYTNPPIEELRRLATIHGGQFNNYHTHHTTHFVCNRFNDSQVKLLMNRQTAAKSRMFYVTSDWIMMSVKIRTRLPEADFLPKELRVQGGDLLTKFFSSNLSSDPKKIGHISDDRKSALKKSPERSRKAVTFSFDKSDDSNPVDIVDAVTVSLVSDSKTTVDSISESTTTQARVDAKPAIETESFSSKTMNPKDTSENQENYYPDADDSNLFAPMHEEEDSLTSVHQPTTSKQGGQQSSDILRQKSNKMNTENPEFLAQYFGRSRLHFIGTWRSRLPIMAAELGANVRQDNSDIFRRGKPSELSTLSSSSSSTDSRVVIHIDMDCFFVNALVRHDPILCQGLIPIAVAHSANGGTSEISSCNYAARAKGVSNGMFMSTAKSLCPDLKVIAYNFQLYEELSRKIYKILYSCENAIVEPVSVDEAYLEFPPRINGEKKAAELRSLIYNETQCTASAGVSYNMLMARLATKRAKPNGLYVIDSPSQATELLRQMKIQELPGVGYALSSKLYEHGLTICSHLWDMNIEHLKTLFGDATGTMLWNASRGIDNTNLTEVKPRRSIGAEVNWGVRFSDITNANIFLEKLCGEVSKRLTEAGYKGRSVTVKVKRRQSDAAKEPTKFLGHGRCDNISKSTTLQSSIYQSADIYKSSLPLFTEVMKFHQIDVSDIRGMGVNITKLVMISPLRTGSPQISNASDMSTKVSSESRSIGNCITSYTNILPKHPNLNGSKDDNLIDTEINQTDNTYVSNEHPNKKILDEDLTSDESDQSNSFTVSQRDFLNTLPEELRTEVMQDILYSTKLSTNGGHQNETSAGSSSSSITTKSGASGESSLASKNQNGQRNTTSSGPSKLETRVKATNKRQENSVPGDAASKKRDKHRYEENMKNKKIRQLDIATSFSIQESNNDIRGQQYLNHRKESSIQDFMPFAQCALSSRKDVIDLSEEDLADISEDFSTSYDGSFMSDIHSVRSLESIHDICTAIPSDVCSCKERKGIGGSSACHVKKKLLATANANWSENNNLSLIRSIKLWIKLRVYDIPCEDIDQIDEGKYESTRSAMCYPTEDDQRLLLSSLKALIDKKRFDKVLIFYRSFYSEIRSCRSRSTSGSSSTVQDNHELAYESWLAVLTAVRQDLDNYSYQNHGATVQFHDMI